MPWYAMHLRTMRRYHHVPYTTYLQACGPMDAGYTYLCQIPRVHVSQMGTYHPYLVPWCPWMDGSCTYHEYMVSEQVHTSIPYYLGGGYHQDGGYVYGEALYDMYTYHVHIPTYLEGSHPTYGGYVSVSYIHSIHTTSLIPQDGTYPSGGISGRVDGSMRWNTPRSGGYDIWQLHRWGVLTAHGYIPEGYTTDGLHVYTVCIPCYIPMVRALQVYTYIPYIHYLYTQHGQVACMLWMELLADRQWIISPWIQLVGRS